MADAMNPETPTQAERLRRYPLIETMWRLAGGNGASVRCRIRTPCCGKRAPTPIWKISLMDWHCGRPLSDWRYDWRSDRNGFGAGAFWKLAQEWALRVWRRGIWAEMSHKPITNRTPSPYAARTP